VTGGSFFIECCPSGTVSRHVRTTISLSAAAQSSVSTLVTGSSTRPTPTRTARLPGFKGAFYAGTCAIRRHYRSAAWLGVAADRCRHHRWHHSGRTHRDGTRQQAAVFLRKAGRMDQHTAIFRLNSPQPTMPHHDRWTVFRAASRQHTAMMSFRLPVPIDLEHC
jgi:hypothetical protein